jgi:hypothetical protein
VVVASEHDKTSTPLSKADSAVLLTGYTIAADHAPEYRDEKPERAGALWMVARFVDTDVVIQSLGA